MRPANCGITPEGWPVTGLMTLATIVFALLGHTILSLVFLLLVAFCLNFFRDPERVVPQGPGLAVSPADGKVVIVDEREDPIDGIRRTHIAVFMNIFSVHVNRAPIQSKVEDIVYWPGKFLNASLDKASKDNERCAYRLLDQDGKPWTVVQIAGLIARRIVCRVEHGDTLARGERFGMIRFGSRLDIYLPEGYAPAVRVGDQVFAGQSVIASRP